ncbi:MAG: hypothetical protein AAF554_15800 [Bacteroidota bacterium]
MKNWILLGVIFSTVFVACNNDDDAAPEADPPLELSEVIAEDNAEIEAFLDTHFYNYEEFASPPADFDFIIDIGTIEGDNSDKTPLSQQMERLTIDLNSDDLGLDGDETVEHAYYILRVRERVPDGPKPTVADSTFLKYEGQLLDGTSFDENQSFTWLELPFTVRGFAEGASELVAGTSAGIVDNPDGTVDITDRGIGMVIFPSAMGYFAGGGPSGTIPAYSPLLFKLDIGLFVEDTDRDNDGIPSILEDVDGNGSLLNDNTDFDSELLTGIILPNFRDADDDQDGIPTRDEISDEDGNIIIPYPDSDNDGTPDYLDPDN